MTSLFKPALLSVLLATAGLAALAHTPAGPMEAGKDTEHMGTEHRGDMKHMNPAAMQAHRATRLAALKAQLKLSAAQEVSWTSYVAAMKPPADMMGRQASYEALAKLPTPERIDQMQALRHAHMAAMSAAMDKHGEATKAFYATLTPEQKKTFDDAMAPHAAGMGAQKDGQAGKHPAPGKPPAPAKP